MFRIWNSVLNYALQTIPNDIPYPLLAEAEHFFLSINLQCMVDCWKFWVMLCAVSVHIKFRTQLTRKGISMLLPSSFVY